MAWPGKVATQLFKRPTSRQAATLARHLGEECTHILGELPTGTRVPELTTESGGWGFESLRACRPSRTILVDAIPPRRAACHTRTR